MLYKYITENNLENCQNYMYSEYGGSSFLDAYMKSRQEIIDKFDYDKDTFIPSLAEDYVMAHNDSLELCGVYFQVVKNKSSDDPVVKNKIDFFIKVFELRKRIYNEYVNCSYRPVEESGYENYNLYIIFGLILCLMYGKTGNLKYLNTLLKLDDTLLSVIEKLNFDEVNFVVYLIKKEVGFVGSLIERENVVV